MCCGCFVAPPLLFYKNFPLCTSWSLFLILSLCTPKMSPTLFYVVSKQYKTAINSPFKYFFLKLFSHSSYHMLFSGSSLYYLQFVTIFDALNVTQNRNVFLFCFVFLFMFSSSNSVYIFNPSFLKTSLYVPQSFLSPLLQNSTVINIQAWSVISQNDCLSRKGLSKII